jgi:CRP-like cAMP-binding protein
MGRRQALKDKNVREAACATAIQAKEIDAMTLRQSDCKNRLLTAMPADVFEELASHFSAVELGAGRSMHEPGKTIDAVYFLESGICSIVVTMEDGVSVEVGVIGRESFVGYPVLLCTGQSPHRTFMQVSGHGFRVNAGILTRLAASSPPLRECLFKAVHGLMVQTAQTAACNRLHGLNERLARWLLICRDRMDGNEVEITQEFLAVMLGTGRSSVTVSAGILQRAGLITYTRGRVTVRNQAGLERAACECYGTIHEENLRLGLLERGELPARRTKKAYGAWEQLG